MTRFICRRCGNCCLNLTDAYQCSVDQADIDMWREKSRDDILEWVDAIDCGHGKRVYDIWINPRTGDDVSRCPWLRKLPKKNEYVCRIHEVKPKVCRGYPKTEEHAKKTGYKVLDP
ncbi:MAG: YkgJ family cysteine cluster protein [Syntrophorhabdales bacterium]